MSPSSDSILVREVVVWEVAEVLALLEVVAANEGLAYPCNRIVTRPGAAAPVKGVHSTSGCGCFEESSEEGSHSGGTDRPRRNSACQCLSTAPLALGENDGDNVVVAPVVVVHSLSYSSTDDVGRARFPSATTSGGGGGGGLEGGRIKQSALASRCMTVR